MPYDYFMYYYSLYIRLFLLLLIIIILYFIFRKRKPSNIISHWHHHFADFNISTIDFYDAIHAKLKDLKLPDVYYQQVEYHQASVFSPKRLYLQVYRFEYRFDICAAPFGTDFFISWWLTLRFGCSPVKRTPKPKTFYQLDTEIMFRESISAVVQEAIEEMLQTKGLRLLSPEEKIPSIIKY